MRRPTPPRLLVGVGLDRVHRHGDVRGAGDATGLLALTACHAEDAAPTSFLDVTPIAAASPPLVSPDAIAVGRDDRVVVADQAPARVLLVDQAGRVTGTIGREGAGPGEYRRPNPTLWDTVIAVFDPALLRLTAFDTAGRVLWSQPAPCCRYEPAVADGDGRFWVPSSGAGLGAATVIGYDATGRVLDTIPVPGSVTDPTSYWTLKDPGEDAARFSTRIPLKPANYFAVSPRGGIWYGFSGTRTIVQGRSGVDTSETVLANWPQRTVPRSTRLAMVEALVDGASRLIPAATLRSLAKADDIPATLPPYFGLRVDACGRLWVLRTPTQLDLPIEWELFSAAGEHIGTIALPIPTSAVSAWAGGRFVLAMIVTRDAEEPQLRLWRLPTAGC